MRTWKKEVLKGYDRRYTVFTSDTHVVTDDDNRPDLVPEKQWLPWALYLRQSGNFLKLLGRFSSSVAAKNAAT
jgi:hypothetical protein